jgi:hypothetical protein
MYSRIHTSGGYLDFFPSNIPGLANVSLVALAASPTQHGVMLPQGVQTCVKKKGRPDSTSPRIEWWSHRVRSLSCKWTDGLAWHKSEATSGERIVKIKEFVHLAYNPSFSACFFSQNSIFLSQQISQQCFSASLSAQPNGAKVVVWEQRKIKRLLYALSSCSAQ